MKVLMMMVFIFLSASLCQAIVLIMRVVKPFAAMVSLAAYNPNTGKGATANKNQNGVTTTQTTGGGKSKSKNGKGVAQGPNGTTCAKGNNNAD